MENEVNTNEPKIVEIVSIKKWKRFLVYLADLFLNFMIAFLLFNIVIAPIGKIVTGFEKQNTQHENITAKMYSLFYENKMVYKSPDYPEYDLQDNIDYSFNFFMSYYACDDETIFPSDSVYVNYKDTENLAAYFVGYANDKASYTKYFKTYNSMNYFIEDSSTLSGYRLKDDIKDQVESFYDINETTKQATSYMSEIKNKLYLPIYSEIMNLIEKNDLKHGSVDMSYIECKKELANLEVYHKALLTICAITSYLISTILYYFILPVLISNKKTLGMKFMRIERIEYNSLNLISTKHYCFSALFNIVLNACLIVFLPVILVGLTVLLKYTVLLYISLISLYFNLVSLGFILVSRYNRSWNDYVNNIVFISTDSLDEIYRSRGYKL